ncbi:MAG: flagellar hook assembly protein FlgD [Deltaproteobacteria bacterium]|nr:flagellar hook assembly protein FlgD [Deltaproteobacteria bacterium]
MTITGLNNVNSTDSQGSGFAATESNEMDKDAFLELLVTQLQYQDPLNPMDSTAFTAQLAEFSSLEQLNNVNENLEYSQLYQSSINNSQAVSFIGKDIRAIGDTISVNNGMPGSLFFTLTAQANDAVVNIYDSNDNLVKSMEAGSLDSGEQTMAWDGTDNYGNTVADGEYQFEIMAYDGSGERVDATTYTEGRVKGVTFKDNKAELLVENRSIALSDIVDVTDSTDL